VPQVFRLSGWWRRAWALLIDAVIVLVTARVLWSLVDRPIWRWVDNRRFVDAYESRRSVGPVDWTTADTYALLAALTAIGIVLGVAALYSGFFMRRWNGATPGRRVTGIRVMRADGGPITVRWAICRDVLARDVLAVVITLVSLGLGTVLMFLWPLWDPEHRGFDDLLARSRVVLDEPPGWAAAPPVSGAEPPAAVPPAAVPTLTAPAVALPAVPTRQVPGADLDDVGPLL